MFSKLRRYAIENEILYLFLHNRVAQLAALVATLMIGGAALAAWVAPTNPYDLTSFDLLDSLLPPSWSADGDLRFIIGTDDQGRDLLSAILYGTRLSLLVGILSITFASILGVTVGLMAGYLGGRFDAIVMRIACLLYTSPSPRDKRQSRMPSSA